MHQITPFICQVAAYYYHGLILEEGNSERSHAMAATALQAADEFLRESKKACEAFNEAPPLSRWSLLIITWRFYFVYHKYVTVSPDWLLFHYKHTPT